MKNKYRPTWRTGPPPCIGWWPASNCKFHGAIRWWNGKGWSAACYRGDPLWFVEEAARFPATDNPANVRWRERPLRWPKYYRELGL